MWDGLLGRSTSPSSIESEVVEIGKLRIDPFNDRPLPAEWAEHGFALAVKHAYLDGDLRPANSDDKPTTDTVPSVAETYAKDAGTLAESRSRRPAHVWPRQSRTDYLRIAATACRCPARAEPRPCGRCRSTLVLTRAGRPGVSTLFAEGIHH